MKKRDSFDIDENEVEELVNSNKVRIERYVDKAIKNLDEDEELYPFKKDYDNFMDWVNDIELDMTDDINNGQYETYSEEWDKLDRLVSNTVEDYLEKKGIDKNYKLNIEMEDTTMRDSKGDLGWISTPELLEKEDFKSEADFEYWVEFLTKLKNASSEQERIDILDNSEFYYEDFVNPYVKEEVKNDIKRIYANRKVTNVKDETNKDIIEMSKDEILSKAEYIFTKKLRFRSLTIDSNQLFYNKSEDEIEISTPFRNQMINWLDKLEKYGIKVTGQNYMPGDFSIYIDRKDLFDKYL